MKHTGLAIGIAALLLAGPVAAKEYFKWVDDNGVTHFTNSPPKDRPSEAVNTYAGSSTKYDPSAANADSAEAKKEKELMEKSKTEESNAASMKAEKCKKVEEQKNYLVERDGTRVRMTDREGNEKVLSPEEQKAEIEKLQKFLDEQCKDKPKTDAGSGATKPAEAQPAPTTPAEPAPDSQPAG